MLNTNCLQILKDLELVNSVIGKYLTLWVRCSRITWFSKTVKVLGGKSANELIRHCAGFIRF